MRALKRAAAAASGEHMEAYESRSCRLSAVSGDSTKVPTPPGDVTPSSKPEGISMEGSVGRAATTLDTIPVAFHQGL